jgi:hypothetical protein
MLTLGYSWEAIIGDSDPWMTMDAGSVMNIVGIITEAGEYCIAGDERIVT